MWVKILHGRPRLVTLDLFAVANLLVKHCLSIRQCKSSGSHFHLNPSACSLVSGSGLCFRSVHNVCNNHFKKIGFYGRIERASAKLNGAPKKPGALGCSLVSLVVNPAMYVMQLV